MSEFYGSKVGAGGCAYQTLATYNGTDYTPASTMNRFVSNPGPRKENFSRGGCSSGGCGARRENFLAASSTAPDQPGQNPGMSTTVVPAYGAPGYNTLTHGAAPGCSGYFGIGAAYQDYPDSCTKNNNRPCA